MKPLISVIVPVYKAEKFLNRCVDSLLAQTYENIEILLIDDGSPDKSGSICDNYAQNNDRIRVIHKQNAGPASARDCGIAAARGEYLGFVDADDFAYPRMYEHLWEALNNANTKLAICGFDCVDSDEIPIKEYASSNPIPHGVFSAKELLPKIVQTNGWAYVVPWNKLYHKSLIDETFFPVGKFYEDEYGIAQLLYRADRIACISESEYHYYYMRKGGQTEGASQFKHLDALEALYYRCIFYHEHGLDELIFDNRTIFLRELEKNYCELDLKNPNVFKRLKQLSKLYGRIPGRGLNETIRWCILNVNPQFEQMLIKWIHSRV